MTDFLRKYKALPNLGELDPGIKPGWKYDVLILQAIPEDEIELKGGSRLILSDQTKNDEMLMSVEALLVDMAPNAFADPDRPAGEPFPYKLGDHILTKKFPSGLKYRGRDGRDYMIIKDTEIIGSILAPDRSHEGNRIRDLPGCPTAVEQAAPNPPSAAPALSLADG